MSETSPNVSNYPGRVGKKAEKVSFYGNSNLDREGVLSGYLATIKDSARDDRDFRVLIIESLVKFCQWRLF